MKRFFAILLGAGLAFSAFCADAATKEKEDTVIALVDKGIKYVEANGIDKAVVQFSNKEGGFINGEFYLFIYKFDGTAVVIGANPNLNNKNLMDLYSQDANGKKVYQVKELINIAKTQGTGWFTWSWQNPSTKKFGPKKGYAKKIIIKGTEYMIGSGFYLGDQ